jgi:hypothetical protein
MPSTLSAAYLVGLVSLARGTSSGGQYTGNNTRKTNADFSKIIENDDQIRAIVKKNWPWCNSLNIAQEEFIKQNLSPKNVMNCLKEHRLNVLEKSFKIQEGKTLAKKFPKACKQYLTKDKEDENSDNNIIKEITPTFIDIDANGEVSDANEIKDTDLSTSNSDSNYGVGSESSEKNRGVEYSSGDDDSVGYAGDGSDGSYAEDDSLGKIAEINEQHEFGSGYGSANSSYPNYNSDGEDLEDKDTGAYGVNGSNYATKENTTDVEQNGSTENRNVADGSNNSIIIVVVLLSVSIAGLLVLFLCKLKGKAPLLPTSRDKRTNSTNSDPQIANTGASAESAARSKEHSKIAAEKRNDESSEASNRIRSASLGTAQRIHGGGAGAGSEKRNKDKNIKAAKADEESKSTESRKAKGTGGAGAGAVRRARPKEHREIDQNNLEELVKKHKGKRKEREKKLIESKLPKILEKAAEKTGGAGARAESEARPPSTGKKQKKVPGAPESLENAEAEKEGAEAGPEEGNGRRQIDHIKTLKKKQESSNAQRKRVKKLQEQRKKKQSKLVKQAPDIALHMGIKINKKQKPSKKEVNEKRHASNEQRKRAQDLQNQRREKRSKKAGKAAADNNAAAGKGGAGAGEAAKTDKKIQLVNPYEINGPPKSMLESEASPPKHSKIAAKKAGKAGAGDGKATNSSLTNNNKSEKGIEKANRTQGPKSKRMEAKNMLATHRNNKKKANRMYQEEEEKEESAEERTTTKIMNDDRLKIEKKISDNEKLDKEQKNRLLENIKIIFENKSLNQKERNLLLEDIQIYLKPQPEYEDAGAGAGAIHERLNEWLGEWLKKKKESDSKNKGKSKSDTKSNNQREALELNPIKLHQKRKGTAFIKTKRETTRDPRTYVMNEKDKQNETTKEGKNESSV